MPASTPYLPSSLPNARLLVTVKAYPKPSGKYEELVCTAGLMEDSKWLRIYPVPYRFLTDYEMYPKYSWVRVNLTRNTTDFRPESYRPLGGLDEEFHVENVIGTKDDWAARKALVLREVFGSMTELIALAKGATKKSLATVKPKEIVGFKIEPADREWKQEWQDQALQRSFLALEQSDLPGPRKLVSKVPYDYSYEFLTEGDSRPRTLKIEDWEIGALYWNCLRRAEGDEQAANRLVRQKYLEDFSAEKDLHLFLGTTKQYHNIAPNPFIIVGVFYPPKSDQELLL